MTDLKPCPFCGIVPIGTEVYPWPNVLHEENRCVLAGMYFPESAWNTRPEPPPLVSQEPPFSVVCKGIGGVLQLEFNPTALMPNGKVDLLDLIDTLTALADLLRLRREQDLSLSDSVGLIHLEGPTPQAALPSLEEAVLSLPNGGTIRFGEGDPAPIISVKGAEAPAPSVREARQKLVDLKDRITERLFQSFEATNAEEILEWLEEAFPLLAASPSQSSSPPCSHCISTMETVHKTVERIKYLEEVEKKFEAIPSPPAPGVGEAQGE